MSTPTAETLEKIEHAHEVIGDRAISKEEYNNIRTGSNIPYIYDRELMEEFPAWETLKIYVPYTQYQDETCISEQSIEEFVEWVNGLAGDDLYSCEFNFVYEDGIIREYVYTTMYEFDWYAPLNR